MADSVMRQGVSRRHFLKAAATVALAHSALGTAQKAGRSLGTGKVLAYVGTYTGAIGAGSNGEGIYLFEMNKSSGELTHRKLVATTSDPSWIAIHPSRKYLYAVNEVSDYQGTSGSVSALRSTSQQAI